MPGVENQHFAQEHPENSEWTCFEQQASLIVHSFFGFEAAVEKLAVKHYAHSIEKGKEIMTYFLTQLENEGVTDVPRVFFPSTSLIELNGGAHGDVPPSPGDSAIDIAK